MASIIQSVQTSSASVIQSVQNFFVPKIHPTTWRVIKGQGVMAAKPLNMTSEIHHPIHPLHQHQPGVMASMMNYFKPAVQPTTWIVNPMGGVRIGHPLKTASSMNTTHPSALSSITSFFTPKAQPTNWAVDSMTGQVHPGHNLTHASAINTTHKTPMESVKAFFTPKIQPTTWRVIRGRGVVAGHTIPSKPIMESIKETSMPILQSIRGTTRTGMNTLAATTTPVMHSIIDSTTPVMHSIMESTQPVVNSITRMFTPRIEPTTWRVTRDGRVIAMGDKSTWSTHKPINLMPTVAGPIHNNHSMKSNQAFLQPHTVTMSNTEKAKEALTSAAIQTKQAATIAAIQTKQAATTAAIQTKHAVKDVMASQPVQRAMTAVNNAGQQAKQAINETFAKNPQQQMQGSLPIEQTQQIRTAPIPYKTEPALYNQGMQQQIIAPQHQQKMMPMENYNNQGIQQHQPIQPIQPIQPVQQQQQDKNVFVSIAQPNLVLTIATGPAQNNMQTGMMM